MLKKSIVILCLAMFCILLCGCGSMFETEYVSVTDYVPTVQDNTAQEGRVIVRNFNALKQAIHKLVLTGEKEGKITVDSAYDGDVVEDMASACWELRTEDALCAYCVDNIAYDIAKIVSYYEATVYVSYSQTNMGNVVNLQYMAAAEKAIIDALVSGQNKLVLLVSRSSYSADNMVSIVSDVYRENPASAPKMPNIEVNMFSGTGMQRLYEIKLSYGMLPSERQSRYEELIKVKPFEGIDVREMTELERAYMACSYLMENCENVTGTGKNSVYAALVEKSADSEGFAYAYVELCKQLGVDCRMIYGQRKWQEHCWNIVRIDNEYYHVDSSVCASNGAESGFMRNDPAMWENYRWDVSSYPACDGEIIFDMALLEN